VLERLDYQRLLEVSESSLRGSAQPVSDDELMAELEDAAGTPDVTVLHNVRTAADKRAVDDVATRQRCADFDVFRPLFEKVQRDIQDGTRQTRPFEMKAEIRKGSWFIVGGQKAYVAEVEKFCTNDQGRNDARLRVIFDNGTESGMLMRSLQRALNKDDSGRRITEPVAGPLFSDEEADGDQASGTIYVLRSKSANPIVSANRELVHKIGVTNLKIAQRTAGARLQPTFLMADVEVVRTYTLFNINRTKLETLVHRIFDPARLDIEIKDRFGNSVIPREWFLVPLFVIDEAVDRIKDGTIKDYKYDPSSAALVPSEV
jgi:hypothetical protein